VHVEGEVVRTRELDEGHGLVECRWKVVNQDGRTVLRMSVEVVWRRVPATQPVLI
jgi:acyl dehydratase